MLFNLVGTMEFPLFAYALYDLIQQLDVSFMFPFKLYYPKVVGTWLDAHKTVLSHTIGLVN